MINTLVYANYAETQGIVIETRENMMFVSNTDTFHIPPKTIEKGGISDSKNPTLFRTFGIGLTERDESRIHRLIFRECGLEKPMIYEYSEPLRRLYLSVPQDDDPCVRSR